MLASITLLKGKIWTGLFGAVRAAAVHRRGDPAGPARLAVGPLALPEPAGEARPADRRERRLRQPVVRAKIRIQDMLAGGLDQQAVARERQPSPGAGPRGDG